MRELPKWVLTNPFPAFFDGESGSAIEQTAKVYGAMQELIGEHNQFMNDLQKQIDDFENGTTKEFECFKKCVTQLIENHVKAVDERLIQQDLKIVDAMNYMKDHIEETTEKLVNEGIESGRFDVAVSYNEETESLDFITTGGVQT